MTKLNTTNQMVREFARVLAFRVGETVYCRFTGQPFVVVSCDGVLAGLRWADSDETSTRIVGELTRTAA